MPPGAKAPAQLAEAQYFANAVGDPEKYPPKDDAMSDLAGERRSKEEFDASLREANGGTAELSEPQRDQQMEDRMQTYLAAQQNALRL